MYNVKGPSKIVAKTTRRGLPQNIDKFRDINKNKINENEEGTLTIVSKPIFNKKTTPNNTRQEPITPEHQEIIKFIHESWSAVCAELVEKSDSSSSEKDNLSESVQYYEEDINENLQDFKPFDLESWWGKRLYAHITSSVNIMQN